MYIKNEVCNMLKNSKVNGNNNRNIDIPDIDSQAIELENMFTYKYKYGFNPITKIISLCLFLLFWWMIPIKLITHLILNSTRDMYIELIQKPTAGAHFVNRVSFFAIIIFLGMLPTLVNLSSITDKTFILHVLEISFLYVLLTYIVILITYMIVNALHMKFSHYIFWNDISQFAKRGIMYNLLSDLLANNEYGTCKNKYCNIEMPIRMESYSSNCIFGNGSANGSFGYMYTDDTEYEIDPNNNDGNCIFDYRCIPKNVKEYKRFFKQYVKY